ncbi:dephospho-CoA kinase [Gramella sp. AN32]|uniref:Dephospho-CoA kinase n=1 Tax=Christiangramia antarctica TaxID=2058158 RepID=A0ABW5X539_9FLAO|nr:dephospho-CoA kinase [Gramella sp. AN32]MCM4157780.1 dephospho-CoA kinase [Gramella sp. AN32]
MMIVGLTGGIGSGKTTVAGMFKDLGIPVYIADDAGKRLMSTSEEIKNSIIKIFGEESYHNSDPNRAFIASKVFKDQNLLTRLNNIIHPAVNADFAEWLKHQHSEYVLYEAAILFEIGRNSSCDFSILVIASKKLKIERLQKRDGSSISQIEDRMANQWSDEKKIPMADFLINNDDLESTFKRVKDIHSKILKAGKNS